MKRSMVNSGFLPPKIEEPTLMVGSLGRSPVRSSVGDEAELAALLGPILREALGQFGQREPVGFLAVDQGFDDVGPGKGPSQRLEDGGLHGFLRSGNISIQGLGSDDRLAAMR